MKFYCVTICLLFSAILFSQQHNSFLIETEDGTKILQVYSREGCAYISVKDFADALSIKFRLNGTEEITLTGKDAEIKIKAKNPFYVIKDLKGNNSRIYQLPTSTYLISGKLFIPVNYSLNILNEVLGLNIKLVSSNTISLSDRNETPTLRDRKPVYNIAGLIIEEKANGTLVRIMSDKYIEQFNSTYNEGVITVSLDNVLSDPSVSKKMSSDGIISKVDVINNINKTELKFHVDSEYSANEIIRVEGGNDLLLTIHNKIFTNRNQERIRDKWQFDVIVLDAGHGGKDAGAIGINGSREKDINLSIALALGKLIEEKMPGVKVEYTRKNDTFVELYKRGRIANEKNGKLFISIHCNSTASRNSNASGFEVYLLRPGRTQEAITIAERENSVIEFEDDPKRYQQLTDENFILVSMAHSTYMKYSEKFSEYLDSHFSTGFDLPNRGVKQAGFYVLVGASMPSVLIEAGFLSSKTDAAYLSSKKGQEKTAELLFESIKSYKNYYESYLGMQ